MKYFSCQPDSHNAFGSLTNGVLTYFTVDCARYKRLSRASGGGVAERGERVPALIDTDTAAASAGSFVQSSSAASRSPAGAMPLLSEASHTPHFATDTRMHVQHTLTLPSSFQATHCCFSMANRTVFGTDMAFLGAANGLLALVVLREDLLLYVAGKDPHSLREAAAQREHRGGGGADASLAVHPGGAVGSISVKGVDEASAVGASSSSRHATGAPSTITWMRDKPLVLVGYTTGRVEWYRVSISPARQQELMNPEKEMPFGASVTSGAFAYQALNRDATTSRVARVVVGGHRDGMRTERVAACQLHDAGALVSSDYFPANGTVAVGSERGGLYLFHADQLEAPLCELRLTTPTAGFLYCHPFLPLVGVVSPVVWAEAGEAGRRRVGDTAGTVAAAASFAQKAEAAVGGSSRSGAVVGQAQRGGSSSPLRRGRRTPQEAALDTPFGVGSGGAEATAKAGRHVGWHDESMQSGLTSSAAVRGASSSSLMTRETMRTGCVLTLVEYTTEAPPRQLARAWAGDEPLAPTHRLTQVLHHRINGAAPRYGTFYNFSWKFSSELELVIGNLEEGAVRVVRMTRRAAAAAAAGGGGGGAAGHLTSSSSSSSHPRRGQVDGEAATSVRGGNATVSVVAQRDDAAAAGCRHDTYAVVQEYNVRLSLHSLANVEYVSAATATLSVLAAPMVGSSNKNSSSGGGAASSSDGSAFQREVERHRRHSTLLAAAARAAADPRARLGFSAAAAASGLLCRPADAFWAGMAVVSLPRHRRDLSGPAAGERGYACCGGGLDGTPRRSFDGGVLDTFYGATAGCAGSEGRLRLGGEGGVIGAGPQLKENALAVAMLQPLRGDGATPGARRHRRHGADASSSSIYGATADGASSSWMQSTSSASTQQPRRRRRRDRDPLTPAVAVPSYAARSTRNEIANAVLIAADHRVDLHQRLRIGPGNVSCVVGMNAAGEVASVPIEVRAVATWHEEGSVFVGLGPTTCAADLVSIQGIERVMRRRHAAGFGVSAAANVAAAKKVGGYGSADVVLLFSYVATLEAVGVVATTGPVPSLMELLRRPATRGRRTVADVAQSHPHLAPRLRMAAQACVFHEDLRRLLALHVLGWLPPSLAEAWRLAAAAESSSAAAAASADVAEWLQLPFEATTLLSESSASADIERAAAVEVTHKRYREAAALLLRFAHRSPSYRAVATLLQRPSDALAMVDSSDPRVCAAFRASLTPWLLVIFHCLCSGVMVRQHDGSRGASPSLPATVLPCDLYQHPALLLWDRVALAVVMEDDASGALAYVLRDVVLPQCNPLQALLLAHGVHQRTSALMQAMVDCTGDFQLGACLFARVGVLTPAAALAFPFLLDGVVQGPQAASALAVAGGGRVGEEAGAAKEGAETTAAAGLPGRLYEPTGNSRSCGGDPSEGVDGPTSWDPTRTTTGGASASPYAYLYSGDYNISSAGGGAHGSRRASPHTAAAASGIRQDGREGTASHTARLVRNSALPPPPLPLSPLPASDASGRALPSSPHGSPIEGRPTAHRRGTAATAAGAAAARQQHSEGWAARYRDDSSNAVGGGRGTEGPDQRRNESSDVNNDDEDEEEETEDFSGEDGELVDAPWVWWAAAYRSFLDDEQAFVRRTTFDVECQQLRSSAVARAVAAAAAAASSNASPAYGGGAAAAARFFSLSRRRSPSLRDLEAAGRRLLTSPERRLSLGAAHRAGGSSSGGGWSPHDAASSSPTPLSGSLSLPYGAPNVGYLPRGYGRTAGLSHAELVVGLHAVGGEAAMAAEGAGAQACVCGELHEGTQLIRSLLNLCSTTTTRCSVCLEPVRLGSCDVSSAFAWCTSCRHGGHAHHLQEWFRTHRRCPMNGCDCHCDEDSNLF